MRTTMNIFKMSIIMTFIFVFLGCATNRYTYDRSTLEDQQCVLNIPKDITVVKFNDDKVNWRVGYNIIHDIEDTFSSPKKREASVIIPEGEHTLTINYSSTMDIPIGYNSYNRITRSAKGIEITYNFEYGKTYSLMPIILGDRIAIFVYIQW